MLLISNFVVSKLLVSALLDNKEVLKRNVKGLFKY